MATVFLESAYLGVVLRGKGGGFLGLLRCPAEGKPRKPPGRKEHRISSRGNPHNRYTLMGILVTATERSNGFFVSNY